MAKTLPIAWNRNRGRDGWSGSPLQIRPDMSADARNVILYNGGLGSKRGGSTSVTLNSFSGVNALIEYVPGQDLTAAELWVVDNSGTKKIMRCAGGTTFVAQTLKDNIASEAYTSSSAVLNGKLYLAYDSTVNRLHVYDPNNASTDTVRRAGLAPFAAAATVANTGAGAYAATLRYYKTRSIEQQSSVAIRRSEGNTAVSFTPSGAGTHARITRPTAVSEGETHWEVYGSTDNATFYGPIATIAIATTTYDDNSTPSSWASTYDAEPTAGTYTPFPSVKSIGTTGTRLYGLGVWETSAGDSLAPKPGRFYFGPVLDSTSTHDDERINNTTTLKGFIDLARNAGSPDRGVSPRPVNNVIFAFQSAGVYGLVPTESDTTPFRRVVYSTSVGNLAQQAIVMGNDRHGTGCVYFLDPTLGPFVVGGSDGLKWCGKDVKDLWDTANKDATTLAGWGIWYADRDIVIFNIATGSSNTPDTMLVLDVTEQFLDEDGDLRGGWTVWTGDFAASMAGCVFSNTTAATRSRVRVPHVGLTSGTVILRYNESATQDDATSFQGYVTSGALAAETQALAVQRAYLRASAQSGVTIQQSLIRNAGDETARTSTVSLTAVGSQTNVLRKFEDAALQDADMVQATLGDAAPAAAAWQLFGYQAELTVGGPL